MTTEVMGNFAVPWLFCGEVKYQSIVIKTGGEKRITLPSGSELTVRDMRPKERRGEVGCAMVFNKRNNIGGRLENIGETIEVVNGLFITYSGPDKDE